MTNKTIVSAFLILLFGCTNAENQPTKENDNVNNNKKETTHNYGGWYCPDNLNGFPAVDLENWSKVPVVSNRLPTQEETRNGTSLIYVDVAEYPSAKAFNIALPKLAKYYNQFTKKQDVVIIIQAIEVEGDTIVGFRYLNGGNGSSHYRDVVFISEQEVASIANAKFVSFDLDINAPDYKIWEVLTKSSYTGQLQPIFDKENALDKSWKEQSNINFNYTYSKQSTGTFAEVLFGNFYIQNDYLINDFVYVDKFLLLRSKDEKSTTIKVVCGPYNQDFETQQSILKEWANKVKELSEK